MGGPHAETSHPLAGRHHPELRTSFLCVGTQKAGTSWLGRALARHPLCHLRAEKELHDWTMVRGPISKRDRAKRRRDLRWAQRRLALSLLPPSPWFILVRRDPLDRLWSSIRRRFRTDIRATRALAPRIDDAFAAALGPRRRTFRMSDDAATIGALEEAVGRERVHCLFFETMRPRAEMDRRGDFLGIGPIPFEAERRVNEGRRGGLAPDAETMARAREALDPVYRYVEQRFATAVPATWRLRAPG